MFCKWTADSVWIRLVGEEKINAAAVFSRPESNREGLSLSKRPAEAKAGRAVAIRFVPAA